MRLGLPARQLLGSGSRLFLGSPRSCCHTAARDVRVRFAPSPTGHLHLGGLRTALYNFLFSRALKGKFILRIEDTDQTRLVPGAAEQLVEMLSWTGIEFDEGPFQGGNHGPYVQSERLSLYKEHAEKLVENGSAYRCFCSSRRLDLMKKQAAARGEVPKYDNRCRHLSAEEVEEKLSSNVPYVIRFKLESYTEPWNDLVYGPITYDVAQIEGDPVVMKSDGFPTYHLANVVDDHLMEISHVLRGVEWQVSTTKHILMYKAFGWNPPLFAHLPLLQNKDGKKLSKRQNDVHVEHYKNTGYFPEAVLNLLTNMGSGFTVRQTAGMDLQQLIQHFDLNRLNTNSTRVDFDKLLEFNRLHLKKIIKTNDSRTADVISQLRKLVVEKFCQGDQLQEVAKNLTDDYLKRVLDWGQDRTNLLTDLLQPQYKFLWSLPTLADLDEKIENAEIITKQIQETVKSLSAVRDSGFDKNTLAAALNSVGHNEAWKYNQYMKLLRRYLTGCQQGPSVAEIMTILGKEATLNRLNEVLNQLPVQEKTETLAQK